MKKVQLAILMMLSLVLVNCSDDLSKDFENNIISDSEMNDLKYLREEEKLARDVYLYAFDKYQENIFDNISKSEQTHMDKVLVLLNKFNIEDSASPIKGEFNNQELSNLYSDLINIVDLSLNDALTVGANIEDLDILDIEKMLLNTDNLEIRTMYENLQCGSKNHIRSFNNKLGGNYMPKYISIDLFNVIINDTNGGCGN
ncbi:MAG: hypothetical protein RIR51_1841 [Bacteroidota bacterium]|jgi:hypothetical protein